jgi:citrate lyase subunit beta/citryl-CoA lyase
MKPIRSFLFVPGNKAGWIEKSVSAGADALILDLEDSVPKAEKTAARSIVAEKIAWLAERSQRVYVRINRSPHLYDLDDLLAVVRPGLEGVVLSKPNGVEDVNTASSMIAEAEMRNGVAPNSVKIIPLLETARSMQLAYEIALLPRVFGLVGATAKNADSARALGYVWTPHGRETLYLKSRVIMAARAAGKLAIGGLWQLVHDLEGLAQSSREDRELGMHGELVLHPSNVPVVNRIYSPTAEEVAYYQGMIATVEKAQAEGRASVIYEGEHVDLAHVQTAREIIELSRALKAP